MKISSIITLFILSSCISKQNSNIKKTLLTEIQSKKIFFNDSIKISDINNIWNIPYTENCNDTIFWSLVKQEGNIPELIDKLTDETILKDIYVPNFGGEYTVADVSLSIINEKIKGIPIFELIDLELRQDCGYCTYWYFVRESKENRLKLQKNLSKWYKENENKLVWVNSDYSLTGDCHSPVGGHYEIKQ